MTRPDDDGLDWQDVADARAEHRAIGVDAGDRYEDVFVMGDPTWD